MEFCIGFDFFLQYKTEKKKNEINIFDWTFVGADHYCVCGLETTRIV